MINSSAGTSSLAQKSQAGIVWLASYPKSGNTWARSFLNNLVTVQEHGIDADAANINRMNRLTSWDISARPYVMLLGKPLKEITHKAIAENRPKVQAQIADESDGLMFVKTHNALVLDHGVPTINMAVSSGAIYIIRNPLDVAVSFSHHLGQSIDTTIKIMSASGHTTRKFGQSVHEVYGSWSENVDSWTRRPNRSLYVMRYEDMHEEPTETFGKLSRHMLLNPTDEELSRAIELSSFSNLQKQEETTGYREKPATASKFFRKGKTGEWRDVLSDKQVASIYNTHRRLMDKFDYAPS